MELFAFNTTKSVHFLGKKYTPKASSNFKSCQVLSMVDKPNWLFSLTTASISNLSQCISMHSLGGKLSFFTDQYGEISLETLLCMSAEIKPQLIEALSNTQLYLVNL